MKVLELNQNILTSMCILPMPHDENKWIKLRNSLISFVVFLTGLTMAISSAYSIYKFINVDLKSCLFVILQTTATFSQTYMLLFGIISRRKFAKLFLNIQQFSDNSK